MAKFPDDSIELNDGGDQTGLSAEHLAYLSPSGLVEAVVHTRNIDLMQLAIDIAAEKYNTAIETSQPEDAAAWFDAISCISEQLQIRKNRRRRAQSMMWKLQHSDYWAKQVRKY